MARMLSKLGWFGGKKLEANAESELFLRINNWLLLQCGGSWFQPPSPASWADQQATEFCAEFVNRVLSDWRLCTYLGRWHWQPRANLPDFPFCWGFKDPRATITLPFWRQLYPQLKVIHVTRHGVDVAQSLLKRRNARLTERLRTIDRRAMAYWYKAKQRRIEIGLSTLKHGLDLWSTYNRHFASLTLEPGRALQVNYESLLQDPRPILHSIVRQFELPANSDAIEQAALMAKPDRAFAYRQSEQLVQFANENGAQLAEFGYQQ